jgi:hypothetical protein
MLLIDGTKLLIVPSSMQCWYPWPRSNFWEQWTPLVSKDSRVSSLHYGEIYRSGRPSKCNADLHRQRIIHERGGEHHHRQVSLHLFLGMCSSCNESVIGRLGEGDVDERGGEEVEDNHQVHKETAHTARRFPQARGEVELVDVLENQIWIEHHNGGPVTTN